MTLTNQAVASLVAWWSHSLAVRIVRSSSCTGTTASSPSRVLVTGVYTSEWKSPAAASSFASCATPSCRMSGSAREGWFEVTCREHFTITSRSLLKARWCSGAMASPSAMRAGGAGSGGAVSVTDPGTVCEEADDLVSSV
jgi:hypothetical protein